MEAPWDEAAIGGGLVISFDGIDADVREAAELDAFREGLKTPPVEDREMDTSASALILLGFAWFTAFAAVRFVQLFADVGGVTALGIWFLGLVAATAIAVARRYRRRANGARAVPRRHFRLRFEGAVFSVADEHAVRRTFDITTIDGFEGGRRLVVRTSDGKRHELPAALPLATDHVALASRLDDALRTARASFGDYRGANLRIATIPAPGADNGDDDERAADAGRKTSS